MSEQVQAHVLKRYSLLKKVGSGAYGHVWKVTDKKTGQTLALKKIFDAFQHSTDAQRTFREITLLNELDHGNVIKLKQVIRAQNDKDLYLVFEYMEADLHNAIGQKILKDAHNRFILYQLVKGIKFLHSAQVIHRDLKPSNLLLNSDCSMKICDFGLARSLLADKYSPDLVLTEEVATRWYRAPEVLLGSHDYGKSADIWSIGCILAQILIGKPLFPGTSTLNQLEKILSFTGKPNRSQIASLNSDTAQTMVEQVSHTKQKHLTQWFKPDTPSEAIELVVRMLQFNPKNRPTAAQLIKSKYLSAFANPKEEQDSKKIVKPPISDNTKLGLKDYRVLIYDHIKKVYREKETHATSLHTCESVRKIDRSNTGQHMARSSYGHKVERSNTGQKNERSQIVHSQGHYYRNYSNNRNQKLRTSENKNSSQMLAGKNNMSYSQHQEDEKLRKKNSIKDLLKNKKYLMSYKTVGDHKQVMKKSLKDYEVCPTSCKENKCMPYKFI